MRSKKRISKKVFKELAAKNVKKSAKDYFIYFFTLTFAVCLFTPSTPSKISLRFWESRTLSIIWQHPRGRSQRFPLCPV